MEGVLEALSSPLGLVIIALGLLAAYLIYSHTYGPFQVLKRYGIRGPTPTAFYGNYKEIAKKGITRFYQDIYDEYGPVCGFYVGRRPSIMIVDLEMLKLILVKEFDAFTDRPPFPDILRKKPGSPRGVLSARGETWKRSRQMISPTFSTLKMKMMAPLIKTSCETLSEKLGECAISDKSVNVHSLYGQFTMEIILATAFGRVVNIQRGEGDQLTAAARVIFAGAQEGGSSSAAYITLLLSHFPFLEGFLRHFASRSKRGDAFELLNSTATKLVKARKKEGATAQYKDLLQLMIDAGSDGEGEERFSDEQIVAHSATFLLAGYETTSNTLSFTSYLLCMHPEVQERLRKEIEEYFQNNPDASMYNATQDLQYLDMVLQESLRLYPPATRIARWCRKTTDVRGVTIPESTAVHVPVYLLHHSSQYWPEPEKFDPERFTPEEKSKRPQMCHMPFGWGPRSCVGMRFALMEAKMALIEILRKYELVQTPDTEVPLKTVQGITMTPKNGIYLKIVKRA